MDISPDLHFQKLMVVGGHVASGKSAYARVLQQVSNRQTPIIRQEDILRELIPGVRMDKPIVHEVLDESLDILFMRVKRELDIGHSVIAEPFRYSLMIQESMMDMANSKGIDLEIYYPHRSYEDRLNNGSARSRASMYYNHRYIQYVEYDEQAYSTVLKELFEVSRRFESTSFEYLNDVYGYSGGKVCRWPNVTIIRMKNEHATRSHFY